MAKVLAELFNSFYSYKFTKILRGELTASFTTEDGLEYVVSIVDEDPDLPYNVEFGYKNPGSKNLYFFKRTDEQNSFKIFSTVMKIIKDSQEYLPGSFIIDAHDKNLMSTYSKIAKKYSRRFGFEVGLVTANSIEFLPIKESAYNIVNDFIAEAKTRAEQHIPAKHLIRRLRRMTNRHPYFPNEVWLYNYDQEDGEIELRSDVHSGQQINCIKFLENEVLPNTGWSLSHWHIQDDEDEDFDEETPTRRLLIRFEHEQRYLNKQKFYYHVASSREEARILREGLKPRSRPDGTYYRYKKGRVYLFSSIDHSLIDSFAQERGYYRPYTVFKIDTDKFKKFNIFRDRAMGRQAVYTNTHIPPYAISVEYRR